jgi:hypothetical protein
MNLYGSVGIEPFLICATTRKSGKIRGSIFLFSMIPEMVFADPLAHNTWELTNEDLDTAKGWILNDIVVYPPLCTV